MRATARLKPSVLWAGVLLGALLAASLPALAGHESDDLRIVTLSTRPDAVSGGDVLVEVKLPQGTKPRDVEITLNRREITRAFQFDAARDALVGLVTGLELGKNVLRARVEEKRHSGHDGRDREARVELKNHPIFGPVFSGPRQTPWICETAASGLGEPPASGPCQLASRYEWFYKASDGTFNPLPSLSPPFPADLVQTTTIDGRTVDFIVRVESGTINESIYRIAIIDDPTNPVANPWSAGGKKPGPGWNGKLFYHFLGGAGPGVRSWRNVVTSALNISDTVSTRDEPLRLGYAVAFGTRNTFGTGANDIISAETVMMIKERFIEQYGLPRYTVGLGSSGGAMHQHLIAHAYPGLLDAITPVRSYPDLVTVVTDVIDCGLLNNYWDFVANPADWPPTKRSKVDGFPIDPMGRTNCVGWNAFARDWPGPTNGFDAVVPLAVRYDPVTNRTGARGTLSGRDRQRLRHRSGYRVRTPALRQRRRSIRTAGAEQRRHHEGGVSRPERAHRRPRHRRQLRCRTQRRRPEGDPECVPDRASQRRRESDAADDPVPELRRFRERHPHLPSFLPNDRAADQEERHDRQPRQMDDAAGGNHQLHADGVARARRVAAEHRGGPRGRLVPSQGDPQQAVIAPQRLLGRCGRDARATRQSLGSRHLQLAVPGPR